MNGLYTFVKNHNSRLLLVKSSGDGPPTSFPSSRANAGEEATTSPAFALITWKEVEGAFSEILTCINRPLKAIDLLKRVLYGRRDSVYVFDTCTVTR